MQICCTLRQAVVLNHAAVRSSSPPHPNSLSDWIARLVIGKQSSSPPVKPKKTTKKRSASSHQGCQCQHDKDTETFMSSSRDRRELSRILGRFDVRRQPSVHEMRVFNLVMYTLNVNMKIWFAPSVFDCPSSSNDIEWDSDHRVIRADCANLSRSSPVYIVLPNQERWFIRSRSSIYFWLPDNRRRRPYLRLHLEENDLVMDIGFKFRAKMSIPYDDDRFASTGGSVESDYFVNGGEIIWEGLGKYLIDKYSDPRNYRDVQNLLKVPSWRKNGLPNF